MYCNNLWTVLFQDKDIVCYVSVSLEKAYWGHSTKNRSSQRWCPQLISLGMMVDIKCSSFSVNLANPVWKMMLNSQKHYTLA